MNRMVLFLYEVRIQVKCDLNENFKLVDVMFFCCCCFVCFLQMWVIADSSDDHYIFSLSFKLNGGVRHVRIEHDHGIV